MQMVSFSKVDTAERVLGLHLGLLVVWEQGPAGGVTCVCRCANNMCAAHHRSCTTEGGLFCCFSRLALPAWGHPNPLPAPAWQGGGSQLTAGRTPRPQASGPQDPAQMLL